MSTPNHKISSPFDVKQMESIFNEDSTEQYAIKNEITPAKEEIRRQQRTDIELLHKISYLKEKIIPDNKKEATRLLVDINQYLLDEHDILKSNEEPRNTEIYENQNSVRGEETNKTLIPSTNEKKNSPETEEVNIFEVDGIRNLRTRRGRREFLIKWKDYDETNNTWEPENNLSPKLVRLYFEQRQVCRRGGGTSPDSLPRNGLLTTFDQIPHRRRKYSLNIFTNEYICVFHIDCSTYSKY